MKKRFFAVFAAVLFVGSTMSMAPVVEIDDPDAATCYAYADRYATRIGFMQNLSHEDEQAVFTVLYNNCMNQPAINNQPEKTIS